MKKKPESLIVEEKKKAILFTKKKNIKSKLFVIAILVITAFIYSLNGRNVTYGYTAVDSNGITWYYQLVGDEACNVRINSGTISGDTLVIPDTLNGYKVTSLSGYNGSKWGMTLRYNITGDNYNQNIKRVEIPSSVNNIGLNAFNRFESLEEVVIKKDENESKTLILGAYAFCQCPKLTTIDLTDVTEIGENAFGNCTNLAQVKMSNVVTKIGNYAFVACSSLTQIELPNTVTTIGEYAFRSCEKLTQINIPESITSIEKDTFSSCKSLENIKIPSSVTSIGVEAFESCTSLKELKIPSSVTSLGNSIISSSGVEKLIIETEMSSLKYANFFPTSDNNNNLKEIEVPETNSQYYTENGVLFSKDKTELKIYPSKREAQTYEIPDTVTTIADYAFMCTKKLTGDLIIPDTVTSIGNYAFAYCTELKGTLSIGNGVITIGESAFQTNTSYSSIKEQTKIIKASIGNGITSIGKNAFEGFKDIWIETTEDSVELDENFGGIYDTKTYVHWKDDTHNVEINVLPGIKIINAQTNEVVTSNDYDCETSFDYRIEIENGYNYSNLKLIEVNDNDLENFKLMDVDINKTYNFSKLIRSRIIYIQEFKEQDLSLRMFISEINGLKIGETRESKAKINNGSFEYLHTKKPINTAVGDIITYTIRIYNEGVKYATADKIHVHFPAGLEFDPEISTNAANDWILEKDGEISTTAMHKKSIRGYKGNGQADYEDIQVALRTTQEGLNETETRLNAVAEIESENKTDEDSTSGSITSEAITEKQQQESENSTSDTYVKGQEDDDDFESVILPKSGKKEKIDYTITVTSENATLLPGTKYNLLKEDKTTVVETQTVDESGTLTFTTITSYGVGTDTYYIKIAEDDETEAVVGSDLQKIATELKVKVMKTNPQNVIITYNIINYDLKINSSEYIPIYDYDQLSKIASNNTVTVNEQEYTFAYNSKYILMNDIDLQNNPWTPISNIFTGTLYGNNHKIKNLTITSQQQGDSGDIGFFRAISGGTIKDLTFENVNISIDAFPTNPNKLMGFTGVGALAGVSNAHIINCHVSGGTIVSKNDNVGGLIGHSIGSKQTINNCSNSAQIVSNGKSNAGGLIGCVINETEVLNCSNTGTISAVNYNAGGLIGYAGGPNGFFVSSTKIKFVNCTNEGSISVTNGPNAAGIIGTSYYIVNLENCINNGAISSSGTNTCRSGGMIGELQGENCETSNFTECVNTGEIKTVGGRYGFTGGIIGTSNWAISVQNCSNSGTISGTCKSGGIIADLQVENSGASLTNNNNTGTISVSGSNAYSSAGIIAHGRGYIQIYTCTNKGSVSSTTSTQTGAGGIIGEMDGVFTINYCKNEGTIEVSGYTSGANAGGIVGKNFPGNFVNQSRFDRSGQNIQIKNCENVGNVNCSGHLGGIVGLSFAEKLDIVGCEVKNCAIQDTSSGDKGGIVGLADCKYMNVQNCNVTKTKIQYKSVETNSRNDKKSGGIIGNVCDYGWTNKPEDYIENVNIVNCNVTDSKVITLDAEAGGIVGVEFLDETSGQIHSPKSLIYGCKVKNCDIISDRNANYYTSAGGIISASIHGKELDIYNCLVDNSNIMGKTENEGMGSISNMNVGGVLGVNFWINEINIVNTDVKNSTINGNTRNDSSGNVAGIMGHNNVTSSRQPKMNIINCDVMKTNISALSGNIAGVYASDVANSDYIINLDNCNVGEKCTITQAIPTPISYTSFCMGGLMGSVISSKKTDINDCSVYDSVLEGNSGNTGGMIGSIMNELTIKNSKVYDMEITRNSIVGNSYANTTAGVIGVSLQAVRMNGVEVNNCNIHNENEYGPVAGIIATDNGTGEKIIKNSIVSGTTITSNVKTQNSSSNKSVGAIAGNLLSKATLENNKVENNTIIKTADGVASGAVGIARNITAKNCYVTDVQVESAIQTENTSEGLTSNQSVNNMSGFIGVIDGDGSLQNINVNNVKLTGSSEVTGGIFGHAINLKQLEDCSVDNLQINITNMQTEYNHAIGGIGSTIKQSDKIANNNIQNSEINVSSHIAGGAFGAILSEATIDNCQVNNVHIQNNNEISNKDQLGQEQNALLGGLVGLTVDNVTINDSTIQQSNLIVEKGTEKPAHIGGIIGFAIEDADVEGTKLISTNIQNNTPKGVTGGIASMTNYYTQESEETDEETDEDETKEVIKTLTINNSSVEDCEKIVGKYHVGGIAGFGKIVSSENNTISNTNIIGEEVENEFSIESILDVQAKPGNEYGDIGGVIGSSLDETNINGITGTGLKVTGIERAGGIAGLYKGTISNANVSSSNITATSEHAQAGGIVAHNAENAQVDQSTVKGSTIKASKGMTGGICGFTNHEATNSTVTNTDIETTDGETFGIY